MFFYKKTLSIALLILTASGFALGQNQWVKVSENLIFERPPFKNCHASTLVEVQPGKLMMACFGGSQEGKNDVAIWAGKLNSKGKVIPSKIADGVINSAQTFPCWNPVLLKKKSVGLVLFYKVGPNPREWWGMYKTSNNDGQTWSAPVKLPSGILGPIKNKAVVLSNNKILCPSSLELNNGRWMVKMETTDMKLKNWKSTLVDTASKFDVIQPSVLFYGGNKLQILCRSKQGNVIQSWSYDNGKTWTALSKTSLINPNSGTDAVTLVDGTQMIVYNPDVPGKDWFNGRSKLNLAVSKHGKTWQDVMVLENGTKEEFSYPAIIQTTDGLIHVTYTYDRQNIKHIVVKEQKN